VTGAPPGYSKDDIVEYFGVRLDEGETQDAMDWSLEVDILGTNPENMSEMYLGATPQYH